MRTARTTAGAAARALWILGVALLVAACQPQGEGAPGGGETAVLETEEQKIGYALGYQLGRNLEPLDLSDAELAAVSQGIRDAVAEAEPKIDVQQYHAQIEQLAASRATAAAEERRTDEAAFLEEARAEEGAEVFDSGMILIRQKEGEGASPGPDDRVTVHYHGTFPDGEVFDSSLDRGRPATFPLSGIIPCWTQALQEMKQGGRAKVVCPPGIAYGDRGAPPRIPPGATLVFQVELLEVHEEGDALQPQTGSGSESEEGAEEPEAG